MLRETQPAPLAVKCSKEVGFTQLQREICTTELADQTANHVRIFMQIDSNEANKLTQFNSEERRKKDTDETDRGKLPKVSKLGGRGDLKLVS